MSSDAIPVAVSGFNWTAAGAWGSFFALLGLLVRQVIPMRKQRIDEFQRIIDTQTAEMARMGERIGLLEKKIDDQRERYEAMLTYERERSENLLAFERASHDAELGVQRHATRNAKQILVSAIDLMEAAPEKVVQHASKIRERMKEMEAAELSETTSIRSARILGAAKVGISIEMPEPPKRPQQKEGKA